MKKKYSVCIGFSGLVFRFLFPNELALPEDFTALLCPDCDTPDEEFEIRLLKEPLRPKEPPIFTGGSIKLYAEKDGCLRIYFPLTAEDGCQIACFLGSDGKNILYYPASRWDYYSSPLRCFHLIAGEALLLRHNAFLLHSSVVMLHDKAILFSGPSGAGKSTQAELWAKHLGAKILNGDRCVVMLRDGVFYGGGSPWCGTSKIRRKEQAPIAGIFLPEKSEENKLQRLGAEAFKLLLTQITVNSWDADFMSRVTQMTAELIAQIPVYRLSCRPDPEAVMLAHHTLFEKEIPK